MQQHREAFEHFSARCRADAARIFVRIAGETVAMSDLPPDEQARRIRAWWDERQRAGSVTTNADQQSNADADSKPSGDILLQLIIYRGEMFRAEVLTSPAAETSRPMRIALLRAALHTIASQCGEWGMDILDLYQPQERHHLRRALEARDGPS